MISRKARYGEDLERGAFLLGAFSVPINWHFSGPEVAYILEDSDAKALVVDADLLPEVESFLPVNLPVLVVAMPVED